MKTIYFGIQKNHSTQKPGSNRRATNRDGQSLSIYT